MSTQDFGLIFGVEIYCVPKRLLLIVREEYLEGCLFKQPFAIFSATRIDFEKGHRLLYTPYCF